MDKQMNEYAMQKLLIQSQKSIISFCLFVFFLLVAFLLKYLFRIQEKDTWPLFVILVGIAIYGIYIQMTIKCPYCNFRLGLVTRLGIPSICPKCKNRLKKR